MFNRKILFITEGVKDEPFFITKIFNTILRRLNVEYNFYEYGTSIYELFDKVKNDPNLSVLDYLISSEQNEDKRSILEEEYNYLYLVFDFDPHYHKFDINDVLEMFDTFTDENDFDRGKIYFNYPMIESFKHLRSLPDPNYSTYFCKLKDMVKYKEYVNDLTIFKDPRKINFETIVEILRHNLEKLRLLLYNDKQNYDSENYDETDLQKLLEYQIVELNKNDRVMILNTILFIVIDYNRRFIDIILKK